MGVDPAFAGDMPNGGGDLVVWCLPRQWQRVANFANSQSDVRPQVLTLEGLEDFGQLRLAFANTLVRRRSKKRWSQVDLAAFCGLEHSYISRLEKGTRTPSIEVVFRLALAFEIAPERLLKEVRTEFEALKA